MSEHYTKTNHHTNTDGNYTAFEDINNENKIILDSIIAIFGAIIIIQSIIFGYFFREIIIKICCKRPIRKFDGMVQLGEISHSMEKEEKEEN